MRILFITPYVPSRIRVRPFQFIRELSKRHEVHVLALEEPGGALHEGVEIVRSCAQSLHIIPHSKISGYMRCFFALGSASPMCTAYSRSKNMSDAVASALARHQFDVIHIEHLRAARFALAAGPVPVVFDSVDCLTSLFRQMAQSRKNPVSRLINFRESLCLSRYEPMVLSRFDRLVVTTHAERQQLIALKPSLSPEVLPNGVDTDYFAPKGTSRHPRRFIFSGKMSYAPNAQAALWFAENVFPALRSRFTDAEFVIAGSAPPSSVLELASRPGITVTGYVPDMRPYLDSSSVAVATMQVAVGIQNKILEAMAMGLPVIAGSSTCRALGDGCPGVIPADEADTVLASALHLAQHPELAAQIGSQGRAKVIQDYTWQTSASRLETIYHELTTSHQAGDNTISRSETI